MVLSRTPQSFVMPFGHLAKPPRGAYKPS